MTNAPLRVGVIGTTTYAETHMRHFAARPDVDFTAIAGRDAGRANAVAERYGVPHVFRGWQDLIESRSVDAVAILAPDDLHEQIALAAFDAGIHVLCEKPLARTPESARRMARAAEASGLVNMSYFFLRTSPLHRYVQSLVSAGAIGRVRSASFTLEHGFFLGDGYNWRFDGRIGGGVIADLGCYLFDLARWYVGDIRAVAARGSSNVERPHPDGEAYAPAADSAVGLLAFDDGAHATFQVSVVSTIGVNDQAHALVLQGERGRLELRHTFSGASLRGILDGEEELRDIPLPDDFLAPDGDAEFIDAILGGVPVSSDFDNGWNVQRVVEAAERAAMSGTWVDVDREAVS